MAKTFLRDGDRACSTGVFIVRIRGKWQIDHFNDDTYYDGLLVGDVEGKPFVEYPMKKKKKRKGK